MEDIKNRLDEVERLLTQGQIQLSQSGVHSMLLESAIVKLNDLRKDLENSI